MKAVTGPALATLAALLAACAAPEGPADARAQSAPAVVAPPDARRPPFEFSNDDADLLEEVQRAAFRFMWDAVAPDTGMVVDRTSKPVVSVAGVGFQLSALPIGVERGWVTRAQAEERALKILRALEANPDNRKHGLFFHYLDGHDAGPSIAGYEKVVSTIDSAILFAGMLTAGSYFGGESRDIADRLFEQANWRAFVPDDESVANPAERGFISLGWKPASQDDPTGDGTLLPYYWVDSGDEHRLVTFLAVSAPKPGHRVPPEMYYRLRRALGSDDGNPPFVWFPWSGALFTNFFAHCWIDYASIGPDDPARVRVRNRPSVDWWENGRRAVAMHRRKAIENPAGMPTLGANAWGLTACDAASGYLVPGLFPTLIRPDGWREEFDFSAYEPSDNFGDGTVAPYGAGSAIVFAPEWSVAALRHYRTLDDGAGHPLVWKGTSRNEFGFRDSFNLGTGWVAPDYVAIDQGPILLLIENARTGRVWKWFHDHPAVKSGAARLGLNRAK